MKKIGILVLGILLATTAWAAPAARTSKTTAAPAMVAQTDESAPERRIDSMTPGLDYSFLMDLKMFLLSNPNYADKDAPSSWFFYTTYRAILANVFQNGFAVMADIEKPGYAGPTYPTLKVNELYAKYKQGSMYVKLGRQEFGDTEDLLLGFQHDALTLGWDLGKMDLMFFIAKTELLKPWADGGTTTFMDGMIGAVPTFFFGNTMKLRGYLLIETEPIDVTSGTPPVTASKTNALIELGAKYMMDLPMANRMGLDLAGQVGVQIPSAEDSAAQAINATAIGMKIDAGYGGHPNESFGFKINAHIVFTQGADMTGTTPKYGFVSQNSLVGSGPGMFDKIQDGAGAYSYVDSHGLAATIQNYAGVFALGATAGFEFGAIQPGVGFWTYSDTETNGKGLGTELDEWVVYRLSSVVSFYQQLGFFMPNKDSLGLPASAPSPGSALKFLLGSSLTF